MPTGQDGVVIHEPEDMLTVPPLAKSRTIVVPIGSSSMQLSGAVRLMELEPKIVRNEWFVPTVMNGDSFVATGLGIPDGRFTISLPKPFATSYQPGFRPVELMCIRATVSPELN